MAGMFKRNCVEGEGGLKVGIYEQMHLICDLWMPYIP